MYLDICYLPFRCQMVVDISLSLTPMRHGVMELDLLGEEQIPYTYIFPECVVKLNMGLSIL